MGKFARYRIHFDLLSNGLIWAHSDPISIEEVEEYIRVFGCGRGVADIKGTGEFNWVADPYGSDENARRLIVEWLSELGPMYPGKAGVLRKMVA